MYEKNITPFWLFSATVYFLCKHSFSLLPSFVISARIFDCCVLSLLLLTLKHGRYPLNFPRFPPPQTSFSTVSAPFPRLKSTKGVRFPAIVKSDPQLFLFLQLVGKCEVKAVEGGFIYFNYVCFFLFPPLPRFFPRRCR